MSVTLPRDVIRGLHKIDEDLARAIVRLYEMAPLLSRDAAPDVALAPIDDRHFLIVINALVIRTLPGIEIVPLDGNRAFLACPNGGGLSDVALSVVERLGAIGGGRERDALETMRQQLRVWHENPALVFYGRDIILVESLERNRHAPEPSAAANGTNDVGGLADFELMPVMPGRSLIVVNSTVVRRFPGVDIVPLGRARGFLALTPGTSLRDLQSAIAERAVSAEPRERQALKQLRQQLQEWQQQPFRFSTRSIIVVESVGAVEVKGRSPRAKSRHRAVQRVLN